MAVEKWSSYDAETGRGICDISLTVRKGEILGIAGLVGAGRTEFVMSLFGLWGKNTAGRIILDGKPLKIRQARDTIQAGIALASEDRKRYGLVLMQDVKRNISMAGLEKESRAGIIDENEEIKTAEKYVAELSIKTPSVEQKTLFLSGGNQQKVVLAKWLTTKPKVLILDEPTRGIDVGAKSEIYNIINTLADNGVAVIIVSSELPEILGMCDRVAVMREGRIAGEISALNATQEQIMQLATGTAV